MSSSAHLADTLVTQTSGHTDLTIFFTLAQLALGSRVLLTHLAEFIWSHRPLVPIFIIGNLCSVWHSLP